MITEYTQGFGEMRKFLLLSLLFLEGCFPHCYRNSPYVLNQTDLSENVQEALCQSSICPGIYPNEEWWWMFDDSQLSEFIEASLACHPDIKIAEARIRRAYYEAKEARSTLFPHLYLFGDVTREKASLFAPLLGLREYFTETTLGFTNLIYELDIWNKNRAIYYAALDEVQAEIADYEEAKLLLSTAIATVYFDLQMQQRRLEITEERVRAREDIYQLLRQQFNLGIISEFFLYQTDTEVQELRDLKFQIEAFIDIDKHALAALVENVSCVKLTELPSAKLDMPFPLPQTLPIDLLARRPDITAQKWRIEASCFDVSAAKARFFPSIDLRSLVAVQSIFIEKLFTGRALEVIGEAIGLLPIFTAGELRAQLGISRENLEIAVGEYNQTILNAVQEVSNALTNLTKSDERHRSLIDGIKDAEDLFDLTNQKYLNGIANRIAVLNAIENLLFQKDLDIQVQLIRFTSAVDLIRSIGGGYYECR